LSLAAAATHTVQQYEKLTAIAQTLCTRDKVDAIILAGTDLSLLFNDSNTAFPHIDCGTLHLLAIVNRLLG
jgi:aspartate/glutamate racemase